MQSLHYKIIVFSLLLVAFSSCDYAKRMKWDEKDVSEVKVHNNFFNNPKMDYIYKAKINVLDNDFGGKVIVKKTDSLTHRVVFATEFGNTIFDFSITPTSYHVNSILDQIDKKVLVKTLALDFQNMISTDYQVIKQYSSGQDVFLNAEVGKRQNYYLYKDLNGELSQINSTKGGKEKTITIFKEIQYGVAHEIDIQHQNIDMNIHLNFIGSTF